MKIRALGGFHNGSRVVEKGEEIELPDGFARELILNGKAVEVGQPLPEQASKAGGEAA